MHDAYVWDLSTIQLKIILEPAFTRNSRCLAPQPDWHRHGIIVENFNWDLQAVTAAASKRECAISSYCPDVAFKVMLPVTSSHMDRSNCQQVPPGKSQTLTIESWQPVEG